MFKEFEIIMKALKYLLIVALIGMTSVLSAANAAAQDLATRPEAQMQSTSVMQGSGSTLPQAAVTGSYMTGNTPGTFAPAGTSGPRRVGEGGGFEDEEDPDNPGEPFPIGDGLWILALLACAYLTVRVTRRRARVR